MTMNARDELTEILHRRIGGSVGETVGDILAAGYRKPRTITTAEELDAAIVRSFEQGENLVLLSAWRPWVLWEDDRGDLHVSSLPVEDDPERLTLTDIALPATVLHEGA